MAACGTVIEASRPCTGLRVIQGGRCPSIGWRSLHCAWRYRNSVLRSVGVGLGGQEVTDAAAVIEPLDTDVEDFPGALELAGADSLLYGQLFNVRCRHRVQRQVATEEVDCVLRAVDGQ
jgi:hypothetical protein